MKGRVFVGSSLEGKHVADAIQQNLEYVADVTVWNQGLFELSEAFLKSLIDVLDKSDFGIFVFTPDDMIKIRNVEGTQVRDNVIFELGLFIGRLGVQRTVFVVSRDDDDLNIPSDLFGITPAKYSTKREDNNLRAALGSACTEIESVIEKLGSIRTELTSRDAINDAWVSLVTGATRSLKIMSGDASWAKRDVEQISKLIKRGVAVRVLCDTPHEHALVKTNIQILLDVGAVVRYYTPVTHIRAIITDWEFGGNGFAMRIQKTPKTAQQHREGVPGSTELYNYQAVRYFPNANAQHMESLGLLFDSLFESGTDAIVLQSLEFSNEQIAKVLNKSGITQYAEIDQTNVELVSLTIDDLWSTCRFVKQPRLSCVGRLVDSYFQSSMQRFESVFCTSIDGTKVIFPPIVEKNEDRYVVIDGMHRLFNELVVNKNPYAQCIVISSNSPLPSQPLAFGDVAIVTEKRSRADNFPAYEGANYRKMKRLDSFLASNDFMNAIKSEEIQ